MSPSPRNKNGSAARDLKAAGKRSKKGARSTSLDRDRPVSLTLALMRRWGLPQPDEDGDKEERGRVLVVGGANEMPGAVILAANAALRAGAGKLQIATCRSIATTIATVVPEARVFALPETKSGAIAASAAKIILEHANRAQCVLIGPGMIGETTIIGLLKRLLPEIKGPALVLDAGALACVEENEQCLYGLRGKVILTPHAGEMAKMLGTEKKDVTRDPLLTARRAARSLRAVIALKGRETFIVGPEGEAYCNRAGNVGLATSGSGDTLSGIIAGLAARGATPLQSAAWGVHLHGRAGDRLARRMGRLGFLARELLAEVPALMSELESPKKS